MTDRRWFDALPIDGRIAPGHALLPQAAALYDSIRRAVAAGIHWIQLREKDLESRDLLELARFAVATAQGTQTRVLINDRLDVAVAANAAGIHLGEKSLPLETVVEWRRAGARSNFQVGVSCHSLESACAAEAGGVDYIFFGPILATPSKAAFGAPQGLDRLREVCASVKIPVLAIGGVDFENAQECLNAGASGIAAIRLFQRAAEPVELAAQIGNLHE